MPQKGCCNLSRCRIDAKKMSPQKSQMKLFTNTELGVGRFCWKLKWNMSTVFTLFSVGKLFTVRLYCSSVIFTHEAWNHIMQSLSHLLSLHNTYSTLADNTHLKIITGKKTL